MEKKRFNFEVTIYENNMCYANGEYCVKECFEVHTNNFDYFKKKLYEKDIRFNEFYVRDLDTTVTYVSYEFMNTYSQYFRY